MVVNKYSHMLKFSLIKNKHPTHEGIKNKYRKRITKFEDDSIYEGIGLFLIRRVKNNNNIPMTEEGIGILVK
jgi:hypothetical protein